MVYSPSRIKGLVFDLDGTLVHTTIDFAEMKRAVLGVLVEEGVPQTELDAGRTITENRLHAITYLMKKGGDPGRLMARTSELMTGIEMIGVRGTRQTEGAGEALKELRIMGMGIAVLTRGSRNYSTLALASAGLSSMIDSMVCRDDYSEEDAKPAPVAMERAARSIGLDVGSCLMVGDHPMDLECATGAGCGFIGVLTGSADAGLWEREGVKMVAPSVADVPDMIRKHHD